MINYLALLSAISISAVAAYYSIVGLVAIFSAQAMPIIVMGTTLEIGKLVAASWVFNNWKTCPVIIRSYLVIAVVVLMFITSMGIFGFLSKAHLDQTTTADTASIEIERIETFLNIEKRRIKNAQQNLDNLEALVLKLDASDAAYTRRIQRKERAAIEEEIKQASQKVIEYQEELIPLRKEQVKIEAEVGPIKYIAELLYETEENKEASLNKAIRGVIIVIVIVFDPLAVILLIAANIGLKRRREEEDPKLNVEVELEKPKRKRKPTQKKWVKRAKDSLQSNKKNDIIEVDKKSIFKMR
jgi:hypothetical protein